MPLPHWKVHLLYGRYGAACGKGNYSDSDLKRTDDPREVTCTRCRQTLRFFSACTGWDYETANRALNERHEAWLYHKYQTTYVDVKTLRPPLARWEREAFTDWEARDSLPTVPGAIFNSMNTHPFTKGMKP